LLKGDNIVGERKSSQAPAISWDLLLTLNSSWYKIIFKQFHLCILFTFYHNPHQSTRNTPTATMLFIQTLILCFLTAMTLAHPGHNVAEEAAERANYFKRSPKSLSKCAANLQARTFEDIDRLHNLANDLRAARGLTKLEARDFAAYNFSHLVPDPSSNVFAQVFSCVLQPDATAGPYLVTGEAFRSDVTNGQEGVPLTLEICIMDTSTCEPVPGVYLDLWHTNATGVYSGL
jgi:hypothetical protein